MKLLLKQLYIDVNDPRNEKIIKILRETKNEFLVKLLYEDSKNLLSDIVPFRQRLLEARIKDPAFGKMFIPMLESEIVDSARSKFYLENLEQLFREEAYNAHLDKRIEMEQQKKRLL